MSAVAADCGLADMLVTAGTSKKPREVEPLTPAAAWALATSDDISNHIQIQTIVGFNRPGQREITAAYADKYFDLIIEYWKNHTYEFASNIALLAFPSYQISDSTLKKIEGWLTGAGKEAPNGLRRIVSEQRDSLARSLKAQAKDAR